MHSGGPILYIHFNTVACHFFFPLFVLINLMDVKENERNKEEREEDRIELVRQAKCVYRTIL